MGKIHLKAKKRGASKNMASCGSPQRDITTEEEHVSCGLCLRTKDMDAFHLRNNWADDEDARYYI